MRDPARIEIVVRTLKAVWMNEPDLRLCQLLVNAAEAAGHKDITKSEIFYLEDEDLLEGLVNISK
jgi:uncharacterized protein YihD (DUF1040 family)